MLSFFGTRTYDLGTMAIRLAGFEIKDCIMWIYGSGFPKSIDVQKAITNTKNISAENSDAEKWNGWGTALKPAHEPICVARKPICRNVANNVLLHGVGAINIAACRIPFVNDADKKSAIFGRGTNILGGNYVGAKHSDGRKNIMPNDSGRWPANVILDEAAAAEMDSQSGILKSGGINVVRSKASLFKNKVIGHAGDVQQQGYGDEGGASRFFYCAKPTEEEKNKGLIRLGKKNTHITVKPVFLMRYLVKMVTPKGGLCIDPHAGSGTTGIACKMESINYIGIDNDQENIEIADMRVAAWEPPAEQLSFF